MRRERRDERRAIIVGLLGGLLLLAAPIGAVDAQGLPLSTPTPLGAEAAIPYGWVDFCSRQPQECAQAPLPAQVVAFGPGLWRALQRVNRAVNAAIEPVSNLEHWGTLLDHWDYPTDGKGDCKIFALVKRKKLIEMGVPRQAVLMTIVRDQDDAGHAVLTVATDHGDYILDNLTDAILPWRATGYRFIKRQSQEDPNIWVSIEAPTLFSARLGSARLE